MQGKQSGRYHRGCLPRRGVLLQRASRVRTPGEEVPKYLKAVDITWEGSRFGASFPTFFFPSTRRLGPRLPRMRWVRGQRGERGHPCISRPDGQNQTTARLSEKAVFSRGQKGPLARHPTPSSLFLVVGPVSFCRHFQVSPYARDMPTRPLQTKATKQEYPKKAIPLRRLFRYPARGNPG